MSDTQQAEAVIDSMLDRLRQLDAEAATIRAALRTLQAKLAAAGKPGRVSARSSKPRRRGMPADAAEPAPVQ